MVGKAIIKRRGRWASDVAEVYQRELLKGAQGKNRTLAQFVDALAAMPLAFQPGSRWNYSYATDVCGRLVESAPVWVW